MSKGQSNDAAQELREADRRARELLGLARWQEALESVEAAKQAVSRISQGVDDGDAQLWLLYGRLINTTTAAVHPAITSLQQEALPLLVQASLSWSMAELLADHNLFPVEMPHWLPVLERQILQHGAVAWHKLVKSESSASLKARVLFERLATKLDPCPAWVQLRLNELGSETSADTPDGAESAAADPAVDEANRTKPLPKVASSPRHLRLVYRPGYAVRLDTADAMELNLAAEGALDPSSDIIQKFLGKSQAVQRQETMALEVDDPLESLSVSLGVLGVLGETVQPAAIKHLPQASARWRTEAQRLGFTTNRNAQAGLRWPGTPPQPLKSYPLLIELDAVELAILRTSLFDFEELQRALEQLELEEANAGFWMASMRQPNWGTEDVDAVDALRRFRRDGGFHTKPKSPQDSMDDWLDAAMQVFCRVGLWGEGCLWTAEEACQWLALPLLQAMRKDCGVSEPIWGAVDPREVQRSLADEEVLYVGPAARFVQQQHESGRAWQLYEGSTTQARGVRCLEPPDGRYPHRPGGGLSHAVAEMIEVIKRWHTDRPFQVAVVSGAAYRLPLCQELCRSLNIRCIALNRGAHEVFGVGVQDRAQPVKPWHQSFKHKINQQHWLSVNTSIT